MQNKQFFLIFRHFSGEMFESVKFVWKIGFKKWYAREKFELVNCETVAHANDSDP